jgi:hypothetical protein
MPGSVHVGFVDKVAPGQVFLHSVFDWQCHSTMVLHTHIIIWGLNNRPVSGRSSETLSHPINMNSNNHHHLYSMFLRNIINVTHSS